MSDATQGLLAELAHPSHIDIPTAQTRMLDSLDLFRDMEQECSQLEALARRAQLSEEDPAVRGKLEGLKQQFAAVLRISRDMARLVNEQVSIFSNLAAELNGIPEERDVPDPEATERAKRAVIEAHESLDAAGVTDGRAREVLKEMEPLLARGVTKRERVRTDGFRQVAERAGYTAWPGGR